MSLKALSNYIPKGTCKPIQSKDCQATVQGNVPVPLIVYFPNLSYLASDSIHLGAHKACRQGISENSALSSSSFLKAGRVV